jgi:signal transduction histidine kinase
VSRRLLASYLTLAAIVLLALEIPLAISFARNERRDLTTKVERDAVALASVSEDVLENRTSTAAIEKFAADYTEQTGGRAVIVRLNGDLVVDTNEPNAEPRSFESRPEIREALAGRVATGTRHSNTLDADFLYVAVPVASGGAIHGAVRITYPTEEVDARVRRSWLILALIAVVVLGVVALVGWRFARATAEPLARLERAAGAAGAGDLTVRAPVEGPPEVKSLATRFNGMVARLGELVGAQEAFVADASHQLRTPLAALRLRLENLEPNVDQAGRESLEAAVAELDRLNRLVDGLLVLARSDAEGRGQEIIDLASLADERVELWSALADEQGVRVEARCTRPARVKSTPGRLEQVLDNLIENALAVSPEGGAITVNVSANPSGVGLHVMDQGPGMSPDERARAFDRFWRSERATTEGTGLGLAIVRRLVESDGGTVDLRDGPAGGLDVAVRLPSG